MSGLDVILWLQEYTNPALTAFFRAVTNLGSVEFYMLAIPLIYWLVDKHFGFRFAVFFVFSAYVNSGLKYIARTERPPRELRLAVQEGYAFPSGHAQGSTVFWGLLALRLRKRWAYWGAALLISLVSLSRLYLGVHWPIDIAGGLAAGLILLLIYSRLINIDLTKIELPTWLLGSVLVAALLYILHPAGDGPMTVGFLLGAFLGYRLELSYVGFKEEAAAHHQVLKAAVGLVVLFLLRTALKPVLSWLPGGLATTTRYTLLGLWATLGAPYIFAKLGWHKKDPTLTAAQ
ncbi:MAG: phosphatase PAP2 family protein [Limnochordia bacterium]|nr:phosphatase PAP2 family protein [Limnochordia bacterium]